MVEATYYMVIVIAEACDEMCNKFSAILYSRSSLIQTLVIQTFANLNSRNDCSVMNILSTDVCSTGVIELSSVHNQWVTNVNKFTG